MTSHNIKPNDIIIAILGIPRSSANKSKICAQEDRFRKMALRSNHERTIQSIDEEDHEKDYYVANLSDWNSLNLYNKNNNKKKQLCCRNLLINPLEYLRLLSQSLAHIK